MKVVLTSGHPLSDYQHAHAVLSAAGVVPAQPSRRRGLSADELHEALYLAHDLDPTGADVAAPLAPGRVWLDTAADLLAANAATAIWGWADARVVWLLDFWKTVEPASVFVLVYSAPEYPFRNGRAPLPASPAELARYLASWNAYNDALARFYLRNPGRCVLVNASGVRHDPVRFVEKVASRLHLWIRAAETEHEADAAGPKPLAIEVASAFADAADLTDALYDEMESIADVTAQKAPGRLSD